MCMWRVWNEHDHEIQQKKNKKINHRAQCVNISKTSRQPAACHQLQLIWLKKKNNKLPDYQEKKTEMKMDSCTSWIGGACFSLAGRNWIERSRRNQTWYRCTNMAVIQRSTAIKCRRGKNSWLNEHVSSLIASTRWCSYSCCCCRQPVTLLELSWDASMCFLSPSLSSTPSLLSFSLSNSNTQQCMYKDTVIQPLK